MFRTTLLLPLLALTASLATADGTDDKAKSTNGTSITTTMVMNGMTTTMVMSASAAAASASKGAAAVQTGVPVQM